jgi:redox-sensitive bicupin YhaK (pirin superfamily)
MSWNPNASHTGDGIETVIVPRSRDLGGFSVRRALPAPQRQMVGPFIFFDHVGPAEFINGTGVDVRPHPHIGLATVTYLYKGEFQHRDSLGTSQMIYPGEVNWMIAGNGVTHSERTSAETRKNPHALHGIQTWVALPDRQEDTDAGFQHFGVADMPVISDAGVSLRLTLGRGWGKTAPAKTFSDMFYADATLRPGAKLPMPKDHEDRGVYVITGSISIAGDVFEAGQMMVLRPRDDITISAGEQGAHVMLLGGETLGGPRFIWWNFVASSQEKIDAAKEAWKQGDWAHGRFQLPPGDEAEFIPLPQ